MSKFRFALVIALTAMVSLSATMYVPVEIAQVPIERLSASLRRAVKQESRNTLYISNLARAHAMAWSLRSDSVPASVGISSRIPTGKKPMTKSTVNYDDVNAVWFGHEPDAVPFKFIAKVSGSTQIRRAQAHLDTALTLYAQAIAINPSDRISRLGRAWLLTQTPHKDSAIAALRALIRVPTGNSAIGQGPRRRRDQRTQPDHRGGSQSLARRDADSDSTR